MNFQVKKIKIPKLFFVNFEQKRFKFRLIKLVIQV